jgi:hypothetical protein
MKMKPKLTAMLETILAGSLLSACGTTPLDLLPKQYQPAMYRDYEEEHSKKEPSLEGCKLIDRLPNGTRVYWDPYNKTSILVH